MRLSDILSDWSLARARPTGGVRWRSSAELLTPPDGGRGWALGGVVAVLAFLAALTAGLAVLMVEASERWTDTVAREATALVRPAAGRDLDTDVAQALAIVRGEAGVDSAYALSANESRRLLEPWLGQGLDLSDLPVPRLIVLKPREDLRPDFQALGRRLRDGVPSASIDDAAGWIGRLRAGARGVVVGAVALLCLVLGACALAVTLATRSAVASNRGVVDVLHLVGASDRFIAGQVVRRFAKIGAFGGIAGVFGAGACLTGFTMWARDAAFEPGGGAGATSGPLLATAVVALVVAGLTVGVSWLTVRRFLRQMR